MATPTADTITLWYHYEEIAMHFNSLIIQFRLQLIGGAAAIGAVSAYLIGAKDVDINQRRWLRSLISSGLFVLIVSAAMLDVFYYHQLLRGAVNALLDFEHDHPEIQMSTKIEAYVGSGKNAVYWSYAWMLLMLGGFAGWSWSDYFKHQA